MGLMLLCNNFIEYDNEKEISSLFAKWTKDINSCRDFRVEAIAYYCGEVHKKINGFLRGTAEIGPFFSLIILFFIEPFLFMSLRLFFLKWICMVHIWRKVFLVQV